MGKYIHVVEDDEDIRHIIEFILKDSNFEVTVSPTVQHFVESLPKHRPDLILLDIMLPDGDGRDVCRSLKSDIATKDIPIIMMSAHVPEYDVKSTTMANDFIGKPFDIENFLKRIDNLIVA